MDELLVIDDENDEYDPEYILGFYGLSDFSREGFVKWSMLNHPDRGGDLEIYQEVNAALLNYTQQNQTIIIIKPIIIINKYINIIYHKIIEF